MDSLLIDHLAGFNPGQNPDLNSFIDHRNSLCYYIDSGTLYSQPIGPPHLQPTKININPLGSSQHPSVIESQVPRFHPVADSQLMVSPNGYYLISKSDKEQVIATDVSYRKGVHFWEFYCPLSLYGVGLGVAKKEGNKWNPQLFNFTASTHRSVYLKLDLNQNKLFAWVNKQKQHVIQLKEGENWAPCVSLKGKGNVVIFNPFSTDPLNKISQYVIFNLIQNPFNTSELQTGVPVITRASPKEYQQHKNIQLKQINQNKILIHDSHSFRIVTRNPKTHRFDFDWSETPQSSESHIELSFNVPELLTLNEYLRKYHISQLASDRKNGDNLYIFESSLKNWFSYFKFLIVHFDLHSATPNLYEIVLSKLERIKGYLYLLEEHLQPLLYSSYNSLRRWKDPNEQNHFISHNYPFQVPLSDFTNYLSSTQVGGNGFNCSASDKYLVLNNGEQLFIYNIQVTPVLVFKQSISTFLKSKQLQNSLINTSKEEGLQIYQILSKCVNVSQQAQTSKTLEVNQRFLNTLVNIFKYPEDISRRALLKTQNESVDDAVAFIQLNKYQSQIHQRKKSEMVEQEVNLEEIKSFDIISSNSALSPVVLSLQTSNQIRVYWLSIDNEELQKLFFKQEKGIVSFVNFEYLKSLQEIRKDDTGYKNIICRKDASANYLRTQKIYTLSIDQRFRNHKLALEEGEVKLLVQNGNSVHTFDVNLVSNCLDETFVRQMTQNQRIDSKIQASSLKKRIQYTFQLFEPLEQKHLHSQPQDLKSVSPSSPFLPLLIQQGPPGCNMNYPICSILYPSTKFLSTYPFTLVFKHLHDKYMKISEVIIERVGKRKGVEVKEGLVWTSNLQNGSLTPPQYAHRFKFEIEQKKLVFKVDEREFKKYLFILPIFDQNKNVNMPFEIGFVGVTGQALEQSSFVSHARALISSKQINKLVTLNQNGKALELLDEAIFDVINNRQVTLEIPHLKDTDITVMKPWVLIRQQQIFSKQTKPKENPQTYENVLEDIIKKKCDHDLNRIKALATVDLSALTEQETLELLKIVQEYPNSPEKKAIIYQITFGPHAAKIKQYFAELLSSQQQVLKIDVLDLVLYHKLYDQAAIEPLINHTIDKIKQSYKKQYKTIRESGNNHLLLESNFYSDYYYNLIEGERSSQNPKIYEKDPLPLNIAIISERFLKTMIIDMKSLVSVNYLLLCFQKTDLKTKMRIRVYDQNKNLLFGNFYQDNTWIQLTKNAYAKQMGELFANPVGSGLNSLGINLNAKTRYLIVEISFTVLPIIGEAAEIANLPKNQIMPEVYGSVIGKSAEISSLSQFINPNPEITHQISNVNINGISEYSRFSTSANNFDYHLYKNIKNIFEEKKVDEIQLSYDMRLQNKDYSGCSKLLKELISKSSGKQPGLDYYYTLLIKLLNEKVAVSKETQTKLYNKIVLNEKGPIQIKTIQYLLSNPEFYQKSLPLLDKDTLKLFSEQKLKQKQIRSYIKNTLAKQSHPPLHTVQLLIYLLRTNPDIKTEEWLQEIIILSQKTNEHKQCFKLLQKTNWIDKDSAKKYLIHLAKQQPEVYSQLSAQLNVQDLIKFSLELIKNNNVDMGIRTLQIVKDSLPTLHNQKLVHQIFKVTTDLLHKSASSEQILHIIEKLLDNPKFEEGVSIVETLLQSSAYLQLSFQRIFFKVIEKQQHKVENLLFQALTGGKLTPSKISKLYLKIVSSKSSPIEQKHLQNILYYIGEYLISECNFGGTQGAQCMTESELSKFIWIDSILQLILNQRQSDFSKLKNIENLNNIILWILINNSNELYHINHAYRTPSYSFIHKIQEKLTSVLSRSEQLKAKILKKIIELTTKLNTDLKQTPSLLQSTRHILFNRLNKGSTQLISLLLKNNSKLYGEIIGSDQLNHIISALKEQASHLKLGGRTEQLTLDNTISNLFVLDKQEDIKVDIKNWSINNTGNGKSSLFSVPKSSSEFSIMSQTFAHVQKIVMGFLSLDNTNKSNIFPHSIDCYAGENKNKLAFLGTLNLIDDQHFSHFNTRVYGLNLNRLHSSGGSWVKSIRNKPFKYLKFKINKPSLVSVADVLESGQKSTGYLSYSVSFMTMEGYKQPKSSPSSSDVYINLLSMLSYPEFKDGLRQFLKKDGFKKKSNQLLSALSNWLKNPLYQKQVLNLMIAISEQSEESGNIILASLLNQSNQNSHSSTVIAEMINRSPSLAPSRIQKFHQHILELIDRASTYEDIHLSISLYLSAVEVTNYNMQKYNIPAFTLPLEEKPIQSLLRIFSDLKESEKHIIIQFFNILLLSQGRITVDKHVALKFVEKVWQLKHKIDFYSLIAALVTINNEITQWFFDNQYLKVVIQELLQGLEKNTEVTNEITLLSALSYKKRFNQEINKNTSQITILKSLSDTKNIPTLLKNVGKQALKYFVEFFKNTCIDTPAELQFTEMLKDILGDLPNKYSIDFIYDFFMPLINSYKSVPVILQPYSRDMKLYIIEPTKVLQKQPIKINSNKQTIRDKFLSNDIKYAVNKIGDHWIQSSNSNDFPNKASILYIQSQNPIKNILIHVQGESITVFDGTIHHTDRLTNTFTLIPNIQLKFTKNANGLTFEHTGFEAAPKLEAYKPSSSKHDLLVNQLLIDSRSSLIFDPKYKGVNSPLQHITKQHLYLLPAELTLETFIGQINLIGLTIPKQNIKKFKLKNLLSQEAISEKQLISDLVDDETVVLKLQYDAEQLFQLTSVSDIVSRSKQFKPILTTNVGLFRSFEKQGGVSKIIEVVIGSVSNWKNQNVAARWLQLVQQLKSFSSFPLFFSLYMQNKENVQLLFSILAALPDLQDPKKWEAKEKQAMKFCYKSLAEVLQSKVSGKLKLSALNNNIIEVILERLFLISKQPKRFLTEEQQLPQTPEIQRKISEEIEKKPIKKKGIGYGTDDSSNTKWNKQEQETAKKQTAQQISNIMKILILFLEQQNWTPPRSIVESVYASSLLPIIESALRGGSLLEISKTADIFQQYLRFIRVVAGIPSLMPILLDVPPKYTPRQTQSIYSLLKQLQGTNKIFLNVASNAIEAKQTYDIAVKIIETYEIVNKAAEAVDNNKEQQNQRILKLPSLKEKYPLLLQDLRFQYINMRDQSGTFKHHYSSYYSKGSVPPSTKMIRLAQQIADASTALPNEHTNAIFIRCDKERVDFMQALIMGPNGTPYGHGAYLFDIYFEDTYPETAPKVNLTTTGNAKVRFNPNLYSCGKVCLSLLGTWRGSASQNWDPKVSTLLQVLISIQSIIMAEDVYFNEPGFEGEQGTVQGEKKNEAYSNIVRYCNIKYAMIDNIKNPPKGFQSIIKRHFYLKKEQILQQVQKWVKYANKREASYTSLVSDHNASWCKQFKKSTTRYRQMLQEAITQLETELNKLKPPSTSDLVKKEEEKQTQKVTTIKTKAQEQKFEDIDVAYNQKIEEKELNIDDEKVKDRWSRYIGAMGIDAVSRQSKANILVYGLDSAALEIIKNLVLSGCKKLSIVDRKQVEWTDLSGNFFLSPEDVGKLRGERCLHKIQELNFYVKVEMLIMGVQESLQKLKEYQVVIVTQLPMKQQIVINTQCHKRSIPFISLDIYGPHARLFNDFGQSFEVLDKNGEDPTEVIIESITNQQSGLVTLLQGVKHPFQDGDIVTFHKVEGMISKTNNEESINGTTQKIKVINSRSFRIGDTTNYTEYIRSGIAKNVKLPVKLSFKTLDQVLNTQQIDSCIDQNLQYYDFAKAAINHLIHHSITALDTFVEKTGKLPNAWNYEDSVSFTQIYKQTDQSQFTVQKERFVKKFSFTSAGTFPPLEAFMGGYVAQEAIKAITKKFLPTNSLFFCDFSNIIRDLPEDISCWAETLNQNPYQVGDSRSQGLRIVIGNDLLKEIQDCKVFMIGSGAIGCQLLKNYAMIELGTKQGEIHLTDPDHIEVSNLNRQFLFREKHLRKPKSATAAFSAIQMNEKLKGHIHFRLDKVSEATKDIFSDEFFQKMTIVTNALDNVEARRYVDQRCLNNRIPLLESGTLGPKGHVQVIIPDLTETYGSKEDPVEEGQIPHCTLKMFPEETLHCIEWARDKFGQKFTFKPKALQKIVEAKGEYKPDASQIQSLRQSLKLVEKKPDNFSDCIHAAINKFYSYYRNAIKQLLYTYPLDFKTKDGQPFWKLPKRPPTAIQKFDPNNILHCTFVTSYAVMLAKIYGIVYPDDFRKEARRFEIGKEAVNFTIEEFIPSDKKAQQISQEVSKANDKVEEEPEDTAENDGKEELNQFELVEQIQKGIVKKEIMICPEEFDKDEDQLGHIDLIYSMANLRSLNYSLEPMDWITTKLKAGKIVPALVTTTTSIAALQTYELVKYLKKLKITQMRNSFINLAVPIINMSEPGEVEKIRIHETLTTNIWDQWKEEITPTTTLRQLFETLQDKYNLTSRDLIVGSIPVYMSALLDLESRKEEKEKMLGTPVKELVKQDTGYADVTVTFTLKEGGELLKKLPKVRLIFK